MTKVLIDDQSLYDIADSIRGKLSVETEYLPSEMAAAIETIQTGTELTAEDAGKVVVEDDGSYVLAEQTPLNVSSNGTYDTTTNDEVVVSVSGGGGGGPTGYGHIYRVWTKSATSSEASVYVQEGYASNGEFVPTGELSELHFDGATKIETDFGLFVVTAYYGNSWNWNITAEADVIVEGNLLTDGDSAKTWRYNATADVIVAAAARLSAKTITQNGTYSPADDNADGYSSVTVNVSGGSSEYLEEWDLTNSATGQTYGLPLALSNVTINEDGAVFDSTNDRVTLPVAWDGMTIEVDVAEMSLASSAHRRFIMASDVAGFIYRSTGVWSFYNGSWTDSSETAGDFFDGSTVKVNIDTNGYWHIYKDGVLWWEPSLKLSTTERLKIGSGSNSINNAVISGIRIL